MSRTSSIVLRNARIHGAGAESTALAVANGLILKVGTDDEVTRYAGPGSEIVDCGGRALIPGIVDDHCHVFAMAAKRLAVDCRPSATPTVDAVVTSLKSSRVRSDGWIRGYGYDDSPLGLGRHLIRQDLDVVSLERPVRVEHRSGHACVLNSAGLDTVGIDRNTPDPPGCTIVRDPDGEPTGLLLDMEDWIRRRTRSRTDDIELRTAIWELSQDLLRYGITEATDAGVDNGIERLKAFESLVAERVIPLRVAMMVGAGQLDETHRAGLKYGDVDESGFLTLGPAKIMLTVSSGNLHPDFETLSKVVRQAHTEGFPVAIHAVEREAVVASALALADHPSTVGNDRIEHCGECPPDVAGLVAASGARVVPNTGFLHYEGERYLRTVPEDLVPHLYPAGALAARGVRVSLGSDAPVVEPNPWAAMAAAVGRCTAQGNPLGGVGLTSASGALDMHTGGRRIAPGGPADIAVVDPDPLTTPLRDLPEIRSVLTVVAGRVVWRDGI